ncbi:hypothetical protein [Streptantibioticus rubrisoli]|uniref:Uncharacterized protein n=2 Tax=Streptantibioticus rubrisoli TaxID=1387313 RepID=A0ABT1PH98_9ACTN|nr:hypothetical protein [Streptantibioticus rubrisoli]MCQ4044741.1 hypothetical protein [Streptantibioticus rubrisoli]
MPYDDGNAPHAQSGWRWCQKCQGLFYALNPDQGTCPADRQAHDSSGSAPYAMPYDDGNAPHAQSGWRWCQKCQGLFYALNPDQGTCPADRQAHDSSGSASYGTPFDVPTTATVAPDPIDVLAPKGDGTGSAVVTVSGFTAPTQLTATLSQAGNQLRAVRYYEAATTVTEPLHREDWPPAWLPPGHPPNPLPLATYTEYGEAKVDGTQPVSVSPGDTITYVIEATGLTVWPPVTGMLNIKGDGWLAPIAVPVSVRVNPLTLTVDSSPLTIQQNNSGALGLQVSSVSPQTEQLTVSGFGTGVTTDTLPLLIPAGSTVAGALAIHTGPQTPVGKVVDFTLQSGTALQAGSPDIEVSVAEMTVSLTGPLIYAAAAGSDVSVPVRVSLNETTENTDITFSAKPPPETAKPPLGISQVFSLSTRHFELNNFSVTDLSHLPQRIERTKNLDPSGSTTETLVLHVSDTAPGGQFTVTFAWQAFNGQQTGTFQVQINVAVRSRTFSWNISSGGLAALGGAAQFTISSDGTTRWSGYAHNSGVDNYDWGFSAVIKPQNTETPVLAVAHHGHLGAREPAASDQWDNTTPPQDPDPNRVVPKVPSTGPNLIAWHFDDYATATATPNTQYSSGIGEFLETALVDIGGFFLGTTPVGQVLGVVIFIGIEAGDLLQSGSFVHGARIAEGILWVLGPSNMLLALAAAAIGEIGDASHEIEQADYDFANQVYADSEGKTTLPPRENILVTNTIGKGNRPFTFENFERKIVMNMGAISGLKNGITADTDVPGETLIHELCHAWQLTHNASSPDLLSKFLTARFQDSAAYDYGPAGPSFDDFGLEAQAQIVQDWFVGRRKRNEEPPTGQRMDPASPYYRYIVGNIRLGQYDD